ncbi:MFS general substrate transporter [Cryphonectria parasitica EP155]|uniref:MFS general substrate transporter n=1 Tax=Cryphonectria parasitica (strain ATCC 38755 / EP155) TaxID=660469 RepID=A0A9P4Y828_CRYP1|nr:MFS general substrate transporter [Cryphonectria parasitica EP155]KAF3768478.1 MFS general substrate transporter [Cryphonectria parasitica EP155]
MASSQDGTPRTWASRLRFPSRTKDEKSADRESVEEPRRIAKWSFGVLNDKETVEVPGSVLLLSNHKNEPLGLRSAPARTSHSSLPTSATVMSPVQADEKKKTSDGKIILEPQPEESANDPLNWPTWRRDAALLSLGLYCMVGGGMTPVLAAGFSNVASDYGVAVARVSLTTGLYMMGMGVGSVFFSPTAILFGKRPVYLFGSLLFIGTSCWCAASPSFNSLMAARVFQGVAVSPVECLPSATIAEIYFLHERAFRIGVYTLLLLGGKNLTPLVSAAIIQSLSWRWVFWIVAFIVAFCGCLLFIFVPETFWDRKPIPRPRAPTRPGVLSRLSSKWSHHAHARAHAAESNGAETPLEKTHENAHFVTDSGSELLKTEEHATREDHHVTFDPNTTETIKEQQQQTTDISAPEQAPAQDENEATNEKNLAAPGDSSPTTPQPADVQQLEARPQKNPTVPSPLLLAPPHDAAARNTYSGHWREREAKSFVQQLRPWHGRLNRDKWLKVAVRPFILYTYPAVLWSSAIYSCSIGWLIVISESVTVIFREDYYKFNALQTGLIYISPFLGGVLGTAVAGKVSDIVVKAMTRRNGGLYEPEFRLVMAAPIAATTIIGLMGYGWSAQLEDAWIVPTVFLGIVSFGCSLGSTTAITFCVDSYRQYAGEALVTLNFSKNIFHGLVFSFFVTGWIEDDGAKSVFIWIGVIQLIVLVFTIPMFVFGKRARMWTVRKNFMEKF